MSSSSSRRKAAVSTDVYPGRSLHHHLLPEVVPPLLPRRRVCTPGPPTSTSRPISRAKHLDFVEERNATHFVASYRDEDMKEFDTLLLRCPSVTRRVIDEALRASLVLPEDEEAHGVAATVSQEQQHLVWDAEEKERQTRRRMRAISARLHETNTGNIRRQHQMALHVQRLARYQQLQQQQQKQLVDTLAFARAATPLIVSCDA